jgi:hypothetical protein
MCGQSEPHMAVSGALSTIAFAIDPHQGECEIVLERYFDEKKPDMPNPGAAVRREFRY